MANRGHRLFRTNHLFYDGHRFFVSPYAVRRLAAGDDEGVVGRGVDVLVRKVRPRRVTVFAVKDALPGRGDVHHRALFLKSYFGIPELEVLVPFVHEN